MKRKLNRNKKGKLAVRSSLFETNSSSMHSFVVTKSDAVITEEEIESYLAYRYDTSEQYYVKDMFVTKDNLLYVGEVGSYGRAPFRILCTFMDKLKYLLCAELGFMYGDEPEYEKKYLEILGAVQEIIPDVNDFYLYEKELPVYKDDEGNIVLKRDIKYNYTYTDKNGNEHPVHKDKEEYYVIPKIGMMDPESADFLEIILKRYGLSYTEFLRNKKYAIVVDGDEYYEWDNLKKSGLINLDFIKEEL